MAVAFAMMAVGCVGVARGLRAKEKVRLALLASGQVWTAHEAVARRLHGEREAAQEHIDSLPEEEVAKMVADMMANKTKPTKLVRVGATLYKRDGQASSPSAPASVAGAAGATAPGGATASATAPITAGVSTAASIREGTSGWAPGGSGVSGGGAAPPRPSLESGPQASTSARSSQSETPGQADRGRLMPRPGAITLETIHSVSSESTGHPSGPLPSITPGRVSSHGGNSGQAHDRSSAVAGSFAGAGTALPQATSTDSVLEGWPVAVDEEAPPVSAGTGGAAVLTRTSAPAAQRTSLPRPSSAVRRQVASGPGAGTASAISGLLDGRLLGITSNNAVMDDVGPDDNTCVICYEDNVAWYVLLECGHGGFCKRCANLLFVRPPNECPTCRARIEQVVELEEPLPDVGSTARVKP